MINCYVQKVTRISYIAYHKSVFGKMFKPAGSRVKGKAHPERHELCIEIFEVSFSDSGDNVLGSAVFFLFR